MADTTTTDTAARLAEIAARAQAATAGEWAVGQGDEAHLNPGDDFVSAPNTPDEPWAFKRRVLATLNTFYGYAADAAFIAAARSDIPFLLAHIAALQADAARYRWLRERLYGVDFCYGDDDDSVLTFSWPDNASVSADLDRSIDSAIASATNEAPAGG